MSKQQHEPVKIELSWLGTLLVEVKIHVTRDGQPLFLFWFGPAHGSGRKRLEVGGFGRWGFLRRGLRRNRSAFSQEFADFAFEDGDTLSQISIAFKAKAGIEQTDLPFELSHPALQIGIRLRGE